MFNVNNITLSTYGINLITLLDFVLTKCCQRIDMFKKVMSFFTDDVALLFYNAIIKSCFSHFLMFWLNDNHSGRYKLIDKVDYLILLLAKRCDLTFDDYVRKTSIFNGMKTSKLQSLSFMYNILHNLNYLPSFSVICNNFLLIPNTRNSINSH